VAAVDTPLDESAPEHPRRTGDEHAHTLCEATDRQTAGAVAGRVS
jgi:hypothetical protein